MGLNKFNQWGNSGSGGSPYPKLEAHINPYPTNLWGGAGSFITQTNYLYYAYRSAVKNNGLRVDSSSVVKLITVTSTGTDTVVATIDPTTYLTNAKLLSPNDICYSTVDQCWYVLLSYVNPTHCRFIKIDDATGSVTTIGAAFNPTSPTVSWPSATNASEVTSFYLDNVSGHLKVVCNGFYHLINKTTGAIVSQDTPLTLVSGSYNLLGCGYITQDATAAHGAISVTDESVSYQRLYGVSGIRGKLHIPASQLSFPTRNLRKLNYIDHDKMYVGWIDNSSANTLVVTVAEYDKFIKAVYDYNK